MASDRSIEVRAMVLQIPSGRVTCYSDVGASLVPPTIGRALGRILVKLRAEDPVNFPWWRVISKNRFIRAPGALRDQQRNQLLQECGNGIQIDEQPSGAEAGNYRVKFLDPAIRFSFNNLFFIDPDDPSIELDDVPSDEVA